MGREAVQIYPNANCSMKTQNDHIRVLKCEYNSVKYESDRHTDPIKTHTHCELTENTIKLHLNQHSSLYVLLLLLILYFFLKIVWKILF